MGLDQMFRKRFTTFALPAMLWLFCQGCGALEHHTFSAPVLGPEHWQAETNGVLLQLDGVDVAIWVQNDMFTLGFGGPYPVPPFIPIWSKVKYSAPLTVQVQFDAWGGSTMSHVASETYSRMGFNPMKVTLESKGKTWQPKGFYSYESQSVSSTPSTNSNRRYSCVQEGEIQTKNEEVTFSGTACFWLEFDRSASPVEPFVLQMAGVTRDGRSLIIPSFSFQKGAKWLLIAVP